MAPRLMTIKEAAAYCRLTVAGYRTWQAKGHVPGPLPGTHRYDRCALDRALDKCSGITQGQYAPANDEPGCAFDAYFGQPDHAATPKAH